MSSIFRFLKRLHNVFHSGCPNLHSQQQCIQIHFSSNPCHHMLFLVLLVLAILTGVRWYLICGFDFHFPDDVWFSAYIHTPIGHLYVFFEKVSGFLLTFHQLFFTLNNFIEFKSYLHIFYINLFRYIICKYLLPFSRLRFYFLDDFFLKAETFYVWYSVFVIFCFCCHCLWSQSKKHCQDWCQRAYCLCFLLEVLWFLVLYQRYWSIIMFLVVPYSGLNIRVMLAL